VNINLAAFYFFFQAEDGIRCFHVTGVQTCALPISLPRRRLSRPEGGATGMPLAARSRMKFMYWSSSSSSRGGGSSDGGASSGRRSEERRVGKECRSRRAPYDCRECTKLRRGGDHGR